MTNTDKILNYLKKNAPNSFTNADLVNRTGIRPHTQVFQITRRLMDSGEIQGRLYGKDWLFWCDSAATKPLTPAPRPEPTRQPQLTATNDVDAKSFEAVARLAMSKYYNTFLREARPDGIPKLFDFVSEDQSVVGNAKFYTMVKGETIPPAKFSTISEYVWLLEKCKARHKFLAFGNQRRVPEEWLSRYGALLEGVEFFFISEDGSISKLS